MSAPATQVVQVPAGVPRSLRHYIGGEHVDSVDGGTFAVADPVRNEPYAQAAAGTPADVDRAVAAARAAFRDGPWPGMVARKRRRVLNRIADAIESRDRAADHPGARAGQTRRGELPLLRRRHRGPA